MPASADILRALKKFIAHSVHRPPQREPFLKEWLRMNYQWTNLYSLAPIVDFFKQYPAARKLVFPVNLRYDRWNLPPFELHLLSCIATLWQAQEIFELGTFDGNTTLQLAKCRPTSHIYTLDLPPQPNSHFTVGEQFHHLPEEKQITQLFGDSLTFDFSPYTSQMDLVFVDANHDYENVRSDSQSAIWMARPGGVIVWDDYTTIEGTHRAVEELLPHYAIWRISNSRFAFLIKSA